MADRHYFQPNDLPKEITVTLYLLYRIAGYSKGALSVTDYWPEECNPREKYSMHKEYVKLSEFQVTIDIPEGIDPTKRYIEVLKREKRKLMAQHHVELKSIEDQIMRVTAIEFKPKES